MGPGYLNNNSMQTVNQNKSFQNNLTNTNPPYIELLCPLINSFGPVNNTLISIGIFILAMFLFPLIILIVLADKSNIPVIILNIIGFVLFYLIILYCIYLVLATYLKPVNDVLSNYVGYLAVCAKTPSS
jgi:hypothetical protein